jgi:hypothetical protein
MKFIPSFLLERRILSRLFMSEPTRIVNNLASKNNYGFGFEALRLFWS